MPKKPSLWRHIKKAIDDLLWPPLSLLAADSKALRTKSLIDDHSGSAEYWYICTASWGAGGVAIPISKDRVIVARRKSFGEEMEVIELPVD
jgi:hypothetical protein